jgi:hypothetical protein
MDQLGEARGGGGGGGVIVNLVGGAGAGRAACFGLARMGAHSCRTLCATSLPPSLPPSSRLARRARAYDCVRGVIVNLAIVNLVIANRVPAAQVRRTPDGQPSAMRRLLTKERLVGLTKMFQVSHCCACIGTPCLRQCAPGASILYNATSTPTARLTIAPLN